MFTLRVTRAKSGRSCSTFICAGVVLLCLPSAGLRQWSCATPPCSTNAAGNIWYTNANVGVGTQSPISTVHIVGTGNDAATDAVTVAISSAATGGVSQGLNLQNSNPTVNSSTGIGFRDGSGGGMILPPASAKLGTVFTDLTNHYGALVFHSRGADGLNERLRIDQSGNVGIGTTNPAYPLTVNGTIAASEVLVTIGLSDYVFDPSYRLAPLSEVNAYIQAHRHLPDIPSDAEARDNGVGTAPVSYLQPATAFLSARTSEPSRAQVVLPSTLGLTRRHPDYRCLPLAVPVPRRSSPSQHQDGDE